MGIERKDIGDSRSADQGRKPIRSPLVGSGRPAIGKPAVTLMAPPRRFRRAVGSANRRPSVARAVSKETFDRHTDQRSLKLVGVVDVSTKKARRRGRPRDEYVHHIVAVGGWEHYYGFSARPQTRHEDAGYYRTETIAFSGRSVLPEGFQFRNVEITLSAHDDLKVPVHEGFRPVIGTMNAADDTLYVYVFIPGDHMPQLVAVAASGRVRVVSFIGTPLKRRSGLISNVSVSTSAEDLSDEDSELL